MINYVNKIFTTTARKIRMQFQIIYIKRKFVYATYTCQSLTRRVEPFIRLYTNYTCFLVESCNHFIEHINVKLLFFIFILILYHVSLRFKTRFARKNRVN